MRETGIVKSLIVIYIFKLPHIKESRHFLEIRDFSKLHEQAWNETRKSENEFYIENLKYSK